MPWIAKVCVCSPHSAPALIKNSIADFDELMHEYMSHLLVSDVHGGALLIASLSPTKGGIGLPLAQTLAPASFLGSVLQSWTLQKDILGVAHDMPRVEFQQTLDVFNQNFDVDNKLQMPQLEALSQPQLCLSTKVDDLTRELLMTTGTARSKALIN